MQSWAFARFFCELWSFGIAHAGGGQQQKCLKYATILFVYAQV